MIALAASVLLVVAVIGCTKTSGNSNTPAAEATGPVTMTW